MIFDWENYKKKIFLFYQLQGICQQALLCFSLSLYYILISIISKHINRVCVCVCVGGEPIRLGQV